MTNELSLGSRIYSVQTTWECMPCSYKSTEDGDSATHPCLQTDQAAKLTLQQSSTDLWQPSALPYKQLSHHWAAPAHTHTPPRPWGDRAIASHSFACHPCSAWHQGSAIWSNSPTPPPDPAAEGNSAGLLPWHPFLYATPISFFTGPPHPNLLGTTQVGLLLLQEERAQHAGNLYCKAYITPPVSTYIWPGLLGLLYRAVDAVQSSLLSVPDKMAIKDWVRGQPPKAISTPKWLIIIMCGLNQEPVMSRVH